DHERRDAAGTLLDQIRVLVLDALQPTDAAAEKATDAVLVHVLKIAQAGVGRSELGGGHEQLAVAIGPAGVLGDLEILDRLEILHLAADLAVVAGGIEE